MIVRMFVGFDQVTDWALNWLWSGVVGMFGGYRSDVEERGCSAVLVH